MNSRIPRRGRNFSAIVLALLALVVLPATAAAHATLIDASPSDESTSPAAVKQVELRFDENVSVAYGGIKAYGPDGKRVDSGKPKVSDKSRVITVPVKGSASGTYAISYRIVSGDGHPIRGALTFHVREKSDNPNAVDIAQGDADVDKGTEWAYGAVRGITLFAMLLLAGGVVFSTCIAPGTRPRLLVPSLVIAVLGLATSFVLDAQNATGLSIGQVFGADVLRAELDTTWGRSVAIQLGLLAVLAVWLRVIDLQSVRGLGRGLLISVPAIAPLCAWTIGGHAIVDEPIWLRIPLDMVHMTMAALWIGGLVQLFAYLRYDAVTIEHVERYSRWMFVAVTVLLLTGLYAAWSEIGLTTTGLTDTTYGRLVIVKSLLLVGIAPLALLNQRRHLPGLRGSGGQQPADARTALRRYAFGELALLALVIAATAALIQTPPARTALGAKMIDQDVRLQSGARAQLIVDPAKPGSNEIHVYAATKTERLDKRVTGVTLRASGPRGIRNLRLPLLKSGPGHWTTPSRTIPFAGMWTFEITVQRGRFETETGTVKARIGARK